MSGILRATTVTAGLVTTGMVLLSCSASSFKSLLGGGSGKAPSSAANNSNTTPPTTEVLPPVPVTGSFLTGVLADSDGSLLAGATMTIVATQHTTTTDLNGEFRIPVSAIPPGNFNMRLAFDRVDPDTDQKELLEFLVETSLPQDLAAKVESEKSNTSLVKNLDDRLGWMFPRNPIGVNNSDGTEVKYILPSATLPKTDAGTNLSILTKYSNVSTGSSARFEWTFPGANSTGWSVVIAYGKSFDLVSQWAMNPVASQSTDLAIVDTYDKCTDTNFRNRADAVPLDPYFGRCGVLFSPTVGVIPNKTDSYYWRIGMKNGNQVLISPVVKAMYQAPMWVQYHTGVESCYPDYYGPNPALTQAIVVWPSNNSTTSISDGYVPSLPKCDDNPLGVQGKTVCTGSADGSPSKCQFCETNLWLCR